VKVDDAVTELTAFLNQLKATAAAEATWKLQLATQNSMEEATASPLMSNLKRAVQSAVGVYSPTLADFGLKPRRVAVVSPADKVEANEKAQATREARKTMGKKQKSKVHGTVAPTTAPTEPTEPAVPAVFVAPKKP
jgi:hypothetical protein